LTAPQEEPWAWDVDLSMSGNPTVDNAGPPLILFR
jgi:hypothetical protein